MLPILAASALALASAGTAQAALDGPVAVDGGLLQGAPGRTQDFEVFKGIPYAAAPVGALRWRPPAPGPKWTGVRPARAFAADCIGLSPPTVDAAASEDCLYLNVWTPAKTPAEKLPVMVWIYGGGFVGGSARAPRYDGDGLNRKGVILVSINYRTGLFGFLAHPLLSQESPRRLSGNYGLLDMIAALKWVRANIAAFGGDPGRVTIFGQSSGSESVNILTASPLAKGLFQRAIGESGGSFGRREAKPLAAAERAGADYALPLGDTLAALRAQPPEALIAAEKGRRFEPVVDGWLLPADAHAIFAAGRQNDVPTLVGSNADESQRSPQTTLDSYIAQTRAQFGPIADKILQIFPASTDDEARDQAKRLGTLLFGDFNAYSWASGQAKTGKAAVYQYRFIHAPPPLADPGPAGAPQSGAFHGAEIIYAFNNLNTQNRAWTEDDQRLARVVSDYWVNFAKTGDPNGPGMPPWPSVQSAPTRVLEIGDEVRTINRPNVDLIGRFEALFYGPGGLYAGGPAAPAKP